MADEQEPVSGIVEEVTYGPGRIGRPLRLRLRDGQEVSLYVGDPESSLTWDGAPVGAGQLNSMLFVAERVTVRLWPRRDRDGAALRAEFSDLR